MLCDQYKDALMEAAGCGAGEALPPVVGEHVSVCPTCREVLTAQQSLFGLVDAELRSRANAAVPGSLNHRVRVALQAEIPQNRKLYFAMAFGSLVAAVLLLAVLLLPNRKYSVAETGANVSIERKTSTSSPAVLSGNVERPELGRSPKVYGRASASNVFQGAQVPLHRRDLPEVLVPKGQEELLAKYMEGIAVGKARATFSANVQHKPNTVPMEVPSTEISELVIRPLPDLSSN